MLYGPLYEAVGEQTEECWLYMDVGRTAGSCRGSVGYVTPLMFICSRAARTSEEEEGSRAAAVYYKAFSDKHSLAPISVSQPSCSLGLDRQ